MVDDEWIVKSLMARFLAAPTAMTTNAADSSPAQACQDHDLLVGPVVSMIEFQ